ncbi:hypothetical protein Tco_1235312 [Tanacetum coccineum]
MAESSEVSFSVVEEVANESVLNWALRSVLVGTALIAEVCSDVRKLGEYRRMSRDLWKSVRRLGVSITELRGLGDCGDGNEALRLFECLRLENVEKVVRLRLMLRETELKIAEKSSYIRKIRGNGAA